MPESAKRGDDGVKKLTHNRTLRGILAFFLLLAVQILLGKAGHFFSNMVSYQQVDPYDIFAGISVHHAVQMIIALILIVILNRLLHIDFCFKLGDVSKGTKYVAFFTIIFAVISVVLHIFMYVTNRLPTYDFPLDKRNILGTLGFQLLLSGPSEETVFRALPITIFIYAFGRSIPIKGNLTLEVMLASVLFSFAHIDWSLSPFVFEVDFFRIFYAFVLGSIQGVVYQKSKSILYPMLMHSCSNVLMVGVGYLFAT